jgi:hypothetical protein
MSTYEYFVLFGLTQLIHSQEEIWTGFHKRWFLFKMPLWVFIAFEIFFSIPIMAYLINPDLPFANGFMNLFAFLMFTNGMEHIIWALVVKKYVPGLVTAPIFTILFSLYYFN